LDPLGEKTSGRQQSLKIKGIHERTPLLTATKPLSIRTQASNSIMLPDSDALGPTSLTASCQTALAPEHRVPRETIAPMRQRSPALLAT
jgi:hypothetical protein